MAGSKELSELRRGLAYFPMPREENVPVHFGVRPFIGKCARLLLFAVLCFNAATTHAHPVVENAIDVVIGPDEIVVIARIDTEQINLVESARSRTVTEDEWRAAVNRHAEYVAAHLHVQVDGQPAPCVTRFDAIGADAHGEHPADLPLVPYRLTYAIRVRLGDPVHSAPPTTVTLSQDFLSEFAGWSAPCVLRIRNADETQFEMSPLERGATVRRPLKLAQSSAAAAGSPTTTAATWPIFRAYAGQGIEHILTGYDHLLFVTALVLAATSFWDLVKVVTTFTVAHTLTLTLSVANVVTLRSAIVEPMIAASIVFVAVQNIVAPRTSVGWPRLLAAFAFGLFHGLGFAGGLKEAMSELPAVTLGLALVAFSIGVELGHQVVVMPMYALLSGAGAVTATGNPAAWPLRLQRAGSVVIAAAGTWYFYLAITSVG